MKDKYYVKIKPEQIKWETEKACLISLKGSDLKFWLSKKLLFRKGNHYQMLVWDGMSLTFIDKNNKKHVYKHDFILENFGFNVDFEIIGDLKDD